MSKSLILIITIFSFWTFIYLSNIKEEQKKEEENHSINDFANDDVQFTTNGFYATNGVTLLEENSKRLITSPVNAKGKGTV